MNQNFKKKLEKDVIIFIHGVGLDHTMYKHQIDYFSKKYKVIAYDMLGHGESEKPEGDYQLIHYVNQLFSLVSEFKMKKVNIVGFSMGAMVAQMFAIKYPDKVKTLTLLNAVAKRNTEQQQQILQRVEKVKKNGHYSTIDEAISRWFTDDFASKNPSVLKEVKSVLLKNPSDIYLKSYSIFAVSDQMLWLELKKIEAPTLIITGERDIGSTPKMALAIGEEIENSNVIIFPNVRHMLPIEMKNELNKSLFDFLSEYNF